MRFALPVPDRSSRLPAMLCAVLGVAFCVQLLIVGGTGPLPAAVAGSARLPNFVVPTLEPVSAARVIVDRPIFSPRRSTSQVQGGQAAAAILDGATIGGTVRIGNRRYGVVRYADGRIQNVGVGALVSGWRLVALGPDSAQFARGGERLTLPYGRTAVPQNEDGARAQEEIVE